MNRGWFRQTETGPLLFLRITPNAGRDAIDGVETRDDGRAVLRIRVAAVPDKGRANDAVIGLLARALGLSRSSMVLVSGQTSCLKTLQIASTAPDVIDRLAALGS